jgi:hypothetical protein
MSNFIPPKRKVVQIAVSADPSNPESPWFFALCDDGSLFFKMWGENWHKEGWCDLPSPPGCE